MSREKEEQQETADLEAKLRSIYSEWDKTKPQYADAKSLNYLTGILALTNDPEKQKVIESKLEALKPKEEVINISISPSELLIILIGLIYKQQFHEASQYVKDSIGKDISSEKRWSEVAEIMLIKNPGEKLKLYDDDAFISYWAYTQAGLAPRKASEEVFKKFKFYDQGACDKWLNRQVNKRKKQSPIYANIPAPSTRPRLK